MLKGCKVIFPDRCRSFEDYLTREFGGYTYWASTGVWGGKAENHMTYLVAVPEDDVDDWRNAALFSLRSHFQSEEAAYIGIAGEAEIVDLWPDADMGD